MRQLIKKISGTKTNDFYESLPILIFLSRLRIFQISLRKVIIEGTLYVILRSICMLLF